MTSNITRSIMPNYVSRTLKCRNMYWVAFRLWWNLFGALRYVGGVVGRGSRTEYITGSGVDMLNTGNGTPDQTNLKIEDTIPDVLKSDPTINRALDDLNQLLQEQTFRHSPREEALINEQIAANRAVLQARGIGIGRELMGEKHNVIHHRNG